MSEIISGVLGGAVILLGYLLKDSLDKRRNLERRLRTHKVEVYSEFFAAVFEKMFLGVKAGSFDVKDIRKPMMKFVSGVMAYGSDEVAEAYNEFRRVIIPQSADASELVNEEDVPAHQRDMLYGLADLILAMRRDLGHENTELSSHQILLMFINDAEKLKPNQ